MTFLGTPLIRCIVCVLVQLLKHDFQKTNKTPALFLVELLAESGLLTVPAGPDVIRWLPPLNVMEDQIMEALDIMRTVFENINR